jgi:hypothetical protein
MAKCYKKTGAELLKFKCLLVVQSTNKVHKSRTVNLTILSNGVIHKIGRRKTAVARVYVSEGTGVITVNKKNSQLTSNSYFTVQSYATNVYDRKCN